MSSADASSGLTPKSEPANRQSEVNPQISDRNSPLETLVFQALRRYGEFAPSTIDGDTMLMFIEFANLIVEDIRTHPYWPVDTDVNYYEHQSDIRKIPDPIMINGLLMHFAVQQGNPRMQIYMQLYGKSANQILYERMYGKSQPKMKVVRR